MTYLAAICVLLIYTGRVVEQLNALLPPAGRALQFAQRVRLAVGAADELRSVRGDEVIAFHRKRRTITL